MSLVSRSQMSVTVAEIMQWITGHSLGCALASVAYSRMVNEIKEIGPNICVRDAYLFAAPILCDVESAGGDFYVFNDAINVLLILICSAFNYRMNHFASEQKTMWRVTNVGFFMFREALPVAYMYFFRV